MSNQKIIDTQTGFKKGKLLYSFNAENKEEAEKKISENVYYNSPKTITMYSLNKGFMYFYLVEPKKGINRNVIISTKEGSQRYQLRMF